MTTQEYTKYRSPIDYLKIFFRRKWLFITPAFVGLVLGVMSAYTMAPVWQSTTVILVEEERIINPLIQNLAVSTTAIQRMQSIRETILGWNSLVELTKKLGLDKNIQNQLDFENLILSLKSNIYVQMPQPNLIRISYTGANPQQTQLVAQTLTDILMEQNMKAQTKETDVAIEFIKEQLSIYKRRIKESEIAALEEQLKTLLTDSTELHPMVKELRQKIAIAKKELDSGEYEIKAPQNQQITANPTREALKQELDKIVKDETDKAAANPNPAPGTDDHDANTSIYKLLLMDKVDSSLGRDMDVNENIYNMLLQKLETAKITQRLETSREGTRYSVIDPARLPLRPIKPNKAKIIFLGLMLGSMSGTGLVFGREFMDHSFLDIDDAKLSLDLPVLGAISRITTQEEIEREQIKKRTLIGAFFACGILLITITLIVAFLKK